MPLAPSDFYRTHLVELHQQLLASPIARTYLTGTGIRLDGAELRHNDLCELPMAKSPPLSLRTRVDATEHCLAHTPVNVIRAAYNRHAYQDKRRAVLQAWADHLDHVRRGICRQLH